MKKLFALILTLIVVFSFSATAFAADDTLPKNDDGNWTITKTYKLVGAGSSPAETFTLTVTPATGSPADGVTIAGAQFAANAATSAGATGDFVVTADASKFPRPGVYEYTVKEVVPTAATPGVTYDSNTYTLKVTVLNEMGNNGLPTGNLVVDTISLNLVNGESTTKVKSITNTYSASELQVSKTVTGNMGDKTKYFDITITLTGETGKTYEAIAYNSNELTGSNNPESVTVGTAATFHIKDGETIKLTNIPFGVTYTVTEADYTSEGYDAAVITYSDNTNKKIDSADADTVVVTNNKENTPDTGITLDSIPYILLLAAGIAAVVVMIIRKRRVVED